MGTYTTNYQLYMPTVGEQGWGELVNNNFTTIDTTMEGLDGRVGEVDSRLTVLETRTELVVPVKLTSDNHLFNTYCKFETTTINSPGTSTHTFVTISALPKSIGLVNIGEVTGLTLTLSASGATVTGYANVNVTMTFYANGVEFMSFDSMRTDSSYTTGTCTGTLYIDGSEDIVITCRGNGTSAWGSTTNGGKSWVALEGFTLSVEPAN